MTEPTITCPNCRTEIKLTESLAAPMLEATKRQFEKALAEKDAGIAKREAALALKADEVAKARAAIDDQVAAKLKAETTRIAADEAKKARAALSNDLEQKDKALADLQSHIEAQNKKLTDAQAAQAELLRKSRELDDAKRELDLTVETRVTESLGVVREKAKAEAEEGLKLKLQEKETQMTSMQKQIEELKRKAEQGSQQLQGEVLELQLENDLRGQFPRDVIEPVPKGEFGGDVLNRVIGPMGEVCGSILWESKRTKNWSDSWLPKLRDDQRTAKAEIALIITNALPKGMNGFGLIDGVWIAEARFAIPVALMLRQSLIEITKTRNVQEGQQTKMALVYDYLTGPRFRHRIEAVIEKFTDMKDDLDRERKTMTRLWAKREEQIRGVVESTAGLYGDLQGIAGKSMNVIEGLEIMLLENDKNAK